MNRVMRTSASLAVGVAEVDAGLIALGFGQFAFLLLVFGKFLVSVGERVARSEHGVGLGGLFFLLAHGAEFVANLAEGRFNGFHFDEKVADFFEKIMKMVGAKHVGEAGGFKIADVLAAGQFRDEVEYADAATICGRDAGKLAQRDKGRAIDARES